MTITRNARIQTLTIRDEQVTAIVMTAPELATPDIADTIETLELPKGALKGWSIHDTHGDHIGRVLSRGGVITAEWYDDLEQADWLLAMWNCRRLERAIVEIIKLRDEVARSFVAAREARNRVPEREQFDLEWEQFAA